MADEQLAPGATNPDHREGADKAIDPNQIDPVGNPKPKEPPAKEPVKDDQKKPDPADDQNKPEDEENEPDDDTPLDVAKWGDTGTETGNAVLQLLQNSGVDTSTAKELLFDAVSEGDVTKIDKAKLEAKVGKVKAHLILTGVTAFIGEKRSEAEAIIKTAHDTVGGKDNWTKITEWANKSVDKAELDELRGMIDAGGRQAKLAAAELKQMYEADKENSSLDTTETKERLPNRGGQQQAVTPLSGPAYAAELEKANNKYFGNPPENIRRSLLARRQEGRKLGL